MQRQLDDSKKGLQSEIDGNHFTNTNRINDIAEKLANMFKDASKDKDDLLLRHSIYIGTESFYLPCKQKSYKCDGQLITWCLSE